MLEMCATLYIIASFLSILFVSSKSCQWLARTFFTSWVLSRERDKKQRALDVFVREFDLFDLDEGHSVKVETAGGLCIEITRKQLPILYD